MSSAADAALVAVVAVAPLAIVLIVALLRGYSIDVSMRRGTRRRRDDNDE